VGAVWTEPDAQPGAKDAPAKSRIQGGHFYIENGEVVAAKDGNAQPTAKPAASAVRHPAVRNPAPGPTQVAEASPARRKDP
jgi:hypothetical protein